MSKFNLEIRKQIKDLLMKRISISEISRRLKMTTCLLAIELNYAGGSKNYNPELAHKKCLERNQKKNGRISLEKKDLLKKLNEEGKNSYQISTYLNINPNTVKRILKLSDKKSFDPDLFDTSPAIENKECVENIECKYKIYKFNFFTFKERELIERLIKEDFSIDYIKEIIGRSKSSINKEISRAGGKKNYTAKRGQEFFENNMLLRKKKLRSLDEEKMKELINLHYLNYTTEQLSNHFNLSTHCIKKYLSRLGLKKKLIPKKKEKTDLKINLKEKVSALEMHLEIILDEIKNLKEKYENANR